jgi:integrase
MATFRKYATKSGAVRWTARVRLKGRSATETFATKGAAEEWARARERAFDTGEFLPAKAGEGAIFADLVDDFLALRKAARRPPGKTFAHALKRLRDEHGLTPAGSLTTAFWYQHALKRLRGGVEGQTVASELTYAGSVLRHAREEGHAIDERAPGVARSRLKKHGIQVTSRQRTERISDDELERLFAWIDANASRTSLPLRDIVEFALATGMRRGEIMALRFSEIAGRVATIKRKHPRDPNRIEQVPLLKFSDKWPRWDALAIIERQPKTDGRVFPYVADTVGFWFERACEGAGVKAGIVFHTLRHECLSRLAQERKFDPLRLAKVGGHRDLRNVQRYAKIDAETLANE